MLSSLLVFLLHKKFKGIFPDAVKFLFLYDDNDLLVIIHHLFVETRSVTDERENNYNLKFP